MKYLKGMKKWIRTATHLQRHAQRTRTESQFGYCNAQIVSFLKKLTNVLHIGSEMLVNGA